MRRGRAPCCAKVGLNRGSWTPEEDMRLIAYVRKYGHANWRALPKQAGLLRCGKSCRLRWINYLRPDLKRGNFTAEEEETIIKLHGLLGNKWSKIASCLPGRTDNEIKNVWHTHLKKKLGQREQQKAGAKNNDKTTWVDEPAASPSSSMTTNCSSGDVGEQCNGSKEPDKIEITALDPDIDIFDMLPDAITTGACPAAPMPTSPCSSSSLSTLVPGVEELLELPEIDIEPNIWSIVDGDSAAAAADVGVRHVGACGGDATVPRTATTTNTRQEEGKEWWLENLERELGLWGPTEDYQDLAAPLADMQWDPVSSYFQAGPTATAFQPPGSSPVLS